MFVVSGLFVILFSVRNFRIEFIVVVLIQNRLRWYGHVMRGDINFQIREVMELEITEKKKKRRPRKL